jgi:hypothetical protein
MNEKKEIYENNGIDVVDVYPEDIELLGEEDDSLGDMRNFEQ